MEEGVRADEQVPFPGEDVRRLTGQRHAAFGGGARLERCSLQRGEAEGGCAIVFEDEFYGAMARRT